MAQDISLLGATYSDVPAVSLPKSGGGTATFIEETELANAGTQTPQPNSGNGSVGTSTSYSREDHVHPKSGYENIDFSNAENVQTTGTSLNSYTTGGIYYFSSTYSPTNKPSNVASYGFLIVLKGGNNQRLVQYWVESSTNGNTMWMRTNSTSEVSWSNWKKLVPDADLKSKEITVTKANPLPSGVTNVGTITAVQTGNVVTVSLDVTRNSTAMSTHAAIASGLPAPKARPTSGSIVVPLGQIYAASSTVGRPLNVTVGTNGNLTVNQGGVAAQYIGTFTYITDEI